MRISDLIKKHYVFLLILVIAFAIRLFFVLEFRTCPVSDYKFYYDIAANFYEGKGLSSYDKDGNIFPNYRWPIGLPLALGILFKIFNSTSYFIAKALNLILTLCTLIMIYMIGLKAFSKRTAILSSLIFCFYPNQILFNNLICTEIPFTFFSTLIFYLLITADFKSHRDSIFIGLLSGLSCYVRGTNILLFALTFLVSLIKRVPLKKSLVNSSVVLILTLLILVPNGIRNKRLFGGFKFLYVFSGRILWAGNNPGITLSGPRAGIYVVHPIPELFPNGSLERRNLRVYFLPWFNEKNTSLLKQGITDIPDSNLEFRKMTPVEKDGLYRQYAVTYMKTHINRTIRLIPLRFMNLYRTENYGTSGVRMGFPSDIGERQWRYFGFFKTILSPYYLAVMTLFIFYILLSFWRQKGFLFSKEFIALLIIAFSTIPFLIITAVYRFHFFMVPLFVVYCGAAFDMFFGKLIRKEYPTIC